MIDRPDSSHRFASTKHMGIDHRGADIFLTERLGLTLLNQTLFSWL